MATEPYTEAPGGGVDIEPTADEQAAFAHLFAKYFAPVYRYVYGHVPLAEEAKDIVHIVFYRIWTRRPRLDTNRSLLPFLCTLARFATVDYLRHERVENRFARQCLQLMELDGPPAAADNAERDLLRQEMADIVTQALDSLSPRQREVMVLRWREQLSYDEIAKQLKISRKTVAMHLSRAMEHLRHRLPDMYDIE
jgi:RNA polymerase sigma-70 factor (family 1)